MMYWNIMNCGGLPPAALLPGTDGGLRNLRGLSNPERGGEGPGGKYATMCMADAGARRVQWPPAHFVMA